MSHVKNVKFRESAPHYVFFRETQLCGCFQLDHCFYLKEWLPTNMQEKKRATSPLLSRRYYQHLRLPALFFLPSYLHLPLPVPTASEHLYMQEPGGKEATLPDEKEKGQLGPVNFSGEGRGVTRGRGWVMRGLEARWWLLCLASWAGSLVLGMLTNQGIKLWMQMTHGNCEEVTTWLLKRRSQH